MDEPTILPHLPGAVLSEQLRLRIPSRPEWIGPTVEYLIERARQTGACPEERSNKLLLSLHEALTNAIIHGNLEISSELKEQEDAFARVLSERTRDPLFANRMVTIEISYDGNEANWTITDEGRGFDYLRFLNAEIPDEATIWFASGRGILLIRAFMDSLRYECGGRRATLTMRRTSLLERRKHPRIYMHHRIRVATILDDGTVDWERAYEAISQNLSEGGLAILQATLTRCTQLVLGLEFNGQMMYLPAQIRHWRVLEGGLVELGCSFLEQFSPTQPLLSDGNAVGEAVDRLLHSTRESSADDCDRRSFPRVSYSERVELFDEEMNSVVTGYARDLSKGGIAFITSTPLPLRAYCIVLNPKGDALHLRAEIIRCTPLTDHFFDVAARFLKVEEAGPLQPRPPEPRALPS